MVDYQVYTVDDIARMLRVCNKTVYHLINTGELKAIQVRGQYRITSDALQQFLKGGQKP